MKNVIAHTDTLLGDFFARKLEQTASLSPRSLELVQHIQELTMRGGKRVRPMLVYAAYVAIRDKASVTEAVYQAGAALELLQTYLLIHDDWMDQDDERRGGKTVHRSFADTYGDLHKGASLGVLAGDLCSAYAWEMMSTSVKKHPAQDAVLALFARIHEEVVFGQQLDILAYDHTQLMYDLKTGSYTVRGPLLLGACLAQASREQTAVLETAAKPLGIAFQLHDDLLGLFADSKITGKPVGGDLREGKYTAIIAAAKQRLSPQTWEKVQAVLGKRSADDSEISEVLEILRVQGIEQMIQEEATTLRRAAVQQLRGSTLGSLVPLLEQCNGVL